MYNPELLDILPNIISYIPRNVILNVVLTCKLFKNNIDIIHDQELVAKTGDLYSLRQIKYSPNVVLKYALIYNHNNIINFIFNKYPCQIYNKNTKETQQDNLIYEDDILYAIGLGGHQKLIKSICVDGFLWTTLFIKKGLIEGNHKHLIGQFKHTDYLGTVKNVYKTNDSSMFNLIHCDIDNDHVKMSMVEGICAQKCKDNINQYIKELSDDLITKYFYPICQGLIEGGHDDIFNQFILKRPNYFRIYLPDNKHIFYLIHTNHFEFFKTILANHTYGFLSEIVYECIHYHRVSFLRWLLDDRYITKKENYLVLAQTLGFTDIIDEFNY